ncbi:MAG: hypothetical protein CML42_06685 [Rhodobacteraceae bacterium]|nr:hypothetical protein [Paracoccaceae bacterium]|tara:strand:+ start:1499 stop:4072 length:2574 start_codon:yes stop_codon:yes gene_type:complete
MTSNVGFFNGRLGIAKSDPNVAVYINTQDAIKLPAGFTSQRPAGLNVEPGMMRYNTTTGKFEGYSGETGTEAWGSLGDGSGGGGGGGGTSSEATGDTTLQGQTLDSVDPNMSGLMTNQSTVVGGGDFEVMGSGTHANLDIIAPAGSANLNLKVGTAASTAATIGWNDTVIDFNKQVKINGNLTLTGNLLESDGVTPRIFSNWTVHSNGNDIYRSSGNVGIGTTTPAYPLHVNGTIGIGVRTDYGAPILQHTSYVSEDYFSIGFSDGTSSGTQNAGKALNVLRKGNVGIGTSDPGTYKLYVNGATYINGTTTATTFSGALTGNVTGNCSGNATTATTADKADKMKMSDIGDSSNTNYHILFGGGSSAYDNVYWDSHLYYNPSTDNLICTTFSGSLSGNVTGNCSGSSGSCTGNANTASKVFVTHGHDPAVSYHRINFTNTSGNGNAYIYASSEFVFSPTSGKVGIGTTSPSEGLEIRGPTANHKIKITYHDGGYVNASLYHIFDYYSSNVYGNPLTLNNSSTTDVHMCSGGGKVHMYGDGWHAAKFCYIDGIPSTIQTSELALNITNTIHNGGFLAVNDRRSNGNSPFSDGAYFEMGEKRQGTYYITCRMRGYTLYTGSHSDMSNYTVSDIRIKKDIEDVPDDYALQKVRDLPCRYYNYKDEERNGPHKIVGFIAQEVEEHLPGCVKKGDMPIFIPNICDYVNDVTWEKIGPDKTDPSKNVFKITCDEFQNYNNTRYRFYFSNNGSKILDEVLMRECYIQEDNSFIIKEIDAPYNYVYVYGEEIFDTITIAKQQIFALHHSAIQEIDRLQRADKDRISDLETKNAALENKVSTLESTLETVLARLTELENTPTDEVVV